MSVADHYDAHGMVISCGDVEAELRRLQGNAALLSCSTMGEAFDQIEEIAAERDRLAAEVATALAGWDKAQADADQARGELHQLRDVTSGDLEHIRDLRAELARAEKATAEARLVAQANISRVEFLEADAERIEQEYQRDLVALGEQRDAARAAVERVRALHAEDEGRCTACVEYCDCLDRGQTSFDYCTHGNVDWPCPTAEALAADVPAAADHSHGWSRRVGSRVWRTDHPECPTCAAGARGAAELHGETADVPAATEATP